MFDKWVIYCSMDGSNIVFELDICTHSATIGQLSNETRTAICIFEGTRQEAGIKLISLYETIKFMRDQKVKNSSVGGDHV